jgi:hypothetical protein
VILVAQLVAHDPAPISYLIAIPVFMIALGITRLLVAGLERIRICSLLPCYSCGLYCFSRLIFAGMPGVSAMVVQNELARISIRRRRPPQ